MDERLCAEAWGEDNDVDDFDFSHEVRWWCRLSHGLFDPWLDERRTVSNS